MSSCRFKIWPSLGVLSGALILALMLSSEVQAASLKDFLRNPFANKEKIKDDAPAKSAESSGEDNDAPPVSSELTEEEQVAVGSDVSAEVDVEEVEDSSKVSEPRKKSFFSNVWQKTFERKKSSEEPVEDDITDDVEVDRSENDDDLRESDSGVIGDGSADSKRSSFSLGSLFSSKDKESNQDNGNQITEEPRDQLKEPGVLDETMEKVVSQRQVIETSRSRKAALAYEQGVLLYHQFKFAEALEMFEEALIFSPREEKSLDYREKCRQILGYTGMRAPQAAQWMGEQQDVMLQELRIKAKYHKEKSQNLMAQAQAKWSAEPGNDDSLKMLEESRYEARRAKAAVAQLPPGEERLEDKERLDDFLSKLDSVQEAWSAIIQRRIEKAGRARSLQLSEETGQYEARRLQDLLTQAGRLFLDEKYTESEDLCQIILNEWPKSAEARLILEKSIRRKDRKLNDKLNEDSEEEWRRNIERVREASIAYSEWVNYSKDWREISAKRAMKQIDTDNESEWIRILKQKLEQRVTLHLPDNSLQEATVMMREQTGVNFEIDSELDLTDFRIIELHLSDVRLVAALELILSNLPTDSPLVYQFVDELVYITTRENQNLFNRPEQVLYDVTDLVTSFGEFGFGEGDGLMTGEALSGVSEVGEGVQALSTDTLMELIKESIDPESWNADGVSVTEYEVGKMLISHSPEVHRQIHELLDMFRKQQKLQVSIEVRFITSEENDLFDVGVEWKGLPEVQMQNLVSSGAGVYSKRTNLESDTRVATLMGSAADSTVDGAPPFITENRASQGFNAQLSILDPIRANIVMHALARKRDVKSLLAPRLTVINNRQGYFLNSIDETYVRNWEPDGGNYVPEVARVSSGELLVVRPTVSSDRRYISLDLSPQITRKLRFENRNLAVPILRNLGQIDSNTVLVTPEVLELTIELPVVEVWQLQTRVQVPDGGVVFVGGRMGNTERKSSRAVPMISKIPFVGRMFRSDGDHVELENLIISVRAKILIFEELESKLY